MPQPAKDEIPLIYSAIFSNLSHTAPREDALAYDEDHGIYVAADGVTRDYDAVRNGVQPYPDPSAAQAAADAVATAVLSDLLRRDAAREAAARVRAALAFANDDVQTVNEHLGLVHTCDYLERDLAGAVASVALIQNHTLAVGWIGDCGVAVIRKGSLVFQTRDQLEGLLAYLRERPAPYDDARRVYIRRELRNRPDFRPDGREVTYGVLTGEPSALPYIQTGSFLLRPGDVVAVYTDGFAPYFQDQAFLDVLTLGPDAWTDGVTGISRQFAQERPGTHGGERSVLLKRIDS